MQLIESPTPRARVHQALAGQATDQISFTAYTNKLVYGSCERQLRNGGMCIIDRVSSYAVLHPNCTEKTMQYTENGRACTRLTVETPHGSLTSLTETDDKTAWVREHLFKTPEDYKALLFYISDAVAVAQYDRIARLQDARGEDFLLRDTIGYEPLHTIAIHQMGLETFSFEWMENRDEVFKLYDAQVALARKIYPLVAEGPLKTANYGGNYMTEYLGPRDFEQYFAPHYNEAAELMHRQGKYLGCHFDGNNTLIMKEIASTALDYVEAYDLGFNPPLQEARALWPNKTLWLNYPCAWHLEPPETVYRRTLELIRAGGAGGHFIIGITEDVPPDRWQSNYLAILSAIQDSR